MPIFGIGLGFQPIAGYNYGAKQYDRLWEVLKHSIFYSTILCVLYSTIIFVFPEFMISIFSSDKELITFASEAIVYVVIIMPLIGVPIIGSMFFLAIAKVVPSFILGLSRQIILLLPLALILSKFLGLQGLWYAFPIADFTAVVITVIWMFVEIQKMKKDNTTVLT